MTPHSSVSRRSEHSDFKQRFVKKQLERGFDVYTIVPHRYWCSDESRFIDGKIDVVTVRGKSVTAYELITTKTEKKARDKLKDFNCDSAYLIWHDGKSFRVK